MKLYVVFSTSGPKATASLASRNIHHWMLVMFVSVNLSLSLCMFNVSNALLMSKATATVCCEGLGWLNLFVI